MNSPTLFRAVVAAGLSFAVVACGPQEELSATGMSELSAMESPVAEQRLSPAEARAAAVAVSGGTTDEGVLLGITYVRPHGIRPLRAAYEVPVTWTNGDGGLVRELIYVDMFDGSVLLRVVLDEATRALTEG